MPREILNICRRCLCRIIKCSTVVHSNISKCSVYFIVDKNVKNGNKILNLNLTLQIEEMMRWADKDGDGVVGVSEFSSLMFDTVRWACQSSPAS